MPQDLLTRREIEQSGHVKRELEVETEEVLRELAYVLHLTRRVRADIDSNAD